MCFWSDYHKKQNTIAALQKKAMEKNPDEFYHKMINSKLEVRAAKRHPVWPLIRGSLLTDMCTSRFVACCQDGVHVIKKTQEEVEVTEEQKKVMRTQDIKYVEMKRVAEGAVSLFPHTHTHTYI